MPRADVKRYWTQLVEGGCILCGGPAEVAHAHGASIVEKMGEPKAKGKKLDRYGWLTLPLCPAHHRTTNASLDLNPEAWEREHGKQADWIDLIGLRFGINLWARAQEGRK